ncbi:MAG: hypothetical protein IJO73_00220 [Clostridia bacterium]|nr:hypothetical protein [Clostridia bacterium]
MIFEAKEITLKNSVKAILKTPETADAEMLLDNVLNASGETDFLSRYPEDWEGFTAADEEKWIKANR